MPALPLAAACRCEGVRVRITQPPLLESGCHCRGCQRMTGSAFSTTLAVPTPLFEVVAGDVVPGGLHGDEAEHMPCDWCKSWVFTRSRAEMGSVNLPATMLDDPSWFARG